MKAHLRAALVAAGFVANAATANAQVTITGTTTGCFYTTVVCTIGSASATTANGYLTFTGGSFSIAPAQPGNMYQLEGAANRQLGTFSLSTSTNGSFGDPLRFRLFVTFGAPSSASPNPFTAIADFDGTVRTGTDVTINDGDDDLYVDFGENGTQPSENAYTIIDYDGAATTSRFAIRVNDVNANLQRDLGPRAIFGAISCQAVALGGTDGCSQQIIAPTTTVPEPSTYALMAAGLAGIATVARRRRRNM